MCHNPKDGSGHDILKKNTKKVTGAGVYCKKSVFPAMIGRQQKK